MAYSNSNSFIIERVAAPTTYLETQAALLNPGEWKDISSGMGGLTSTLTQQASDWNFSILEYASKGVYNPSLKKIQYLGEAHQATQQGGHSDVYPGHRMLSYDEVGNNWVCHTISPISYIAHGYDMSVMDPATGTFYTMLYTTANPKPFYKTLDDATTPLVQFGSWSSGSGQPQFGMDWDATRQKLIIYSDDTGLWTCDAAGTFQQLYTGSAFGGQANIGPYHHGVRYHPPSAACWLIPGNGFTGHFRLNANGTLTALATPPTARFGLCGTGGVTLAYDARTGKFIFFDPYANEMRQFDLTTDTWSAPFIPINKSTGSPQNIPWSNTVTHSVVGISVTIPNYNVIMYFVNGQNIPTVNRVYLYKHNAL